MNVNMYAGQDPIKTKELWTNSHSDYSKERIDYYYESQAGNHITLLMEENGTAVSMLTLVPFLTNRNEEICMLTGAATRQEYRRQGLMEELLKQAFSCMQSEQEPYTLLCTPQSEIFARYGFTEIGRKETYVVSAKSERRLKNACENCEITFDAEQGLTISAAANEDIDAIYDFANAYFNNHADVYLVRSKEYYSKKQKELQVTRGNLLTIKRNGEIVGIMNVSCNPAFCIEEVLCEDALCFGLLQERKEADRQVMARIINVKKMFSTLYSENKEFVLSVRVHDELMIENDQIFMLHCSPVGGSIQAIGIPVAMVNKDGEHCVAECEVNIDKLTSFLFGKEDAKDCFHVFAQSKQAEVYSELNKLQRCRSIYIREDN